MYSALFRHCYFKSELEEHLTNTTMKINIQSNVFERSVFKVLDKQNSYPKQNINSTHQEINFIKGWSIKIWSEKLLSSSTYFCCPNLISIVWTLVRIF
jgi:hypothetical protein